MRSLKCEKLVGKGGLGREGRQKGKYCDALILMAKKHRWKLNGVVK